MTLDTYVAAAFVLFTLWFVKSSISDYKLAKQSRAYVSVRGRISHLHLWGKSASRKTRLHIEYEYSYKGKDFKGRRIAFYTIHWPQTEEFAAAHPLHSDIDIYVDQNKPSQSVLIPGVHPKKPHSEIYLSVFSVFISLVVFTGLLYFGG